MLLLVTSTNVNARDNRDHFSNQIIEAEDRDCICYFEASLGRAESGFYAGPAHFDRKNAPLEVLAVDPASPSMWTANFALADYATGETGVKPVLGFSLLDNASSLFVRADPDKPGALSATIIKSVDDFVEGRIVGTVLDASPGGKGDPVTLEVHFGATLALSDVATACDQEWEEPLAWRASHALNNNR